MNVLIADDSQEIKKRVKEILKPFPEVIIKEASSGKEALDVYYEVNPELVILDIQMPNGNGLAVLKMIKLNKPNDVKIIMLTNHEEGPYKKRCMELGADYFLVKSSEFQRLPKIIERIIEHHNHPSRKPTAETSSADHIDQL